MSNQAKLIKFFERNILNYRVPKDINILYFLGAILLFLIIVQIMSGIGLAIHYVPSSSEAFLSISRMLKDYPYSWIVKSLHSNGASLMFVFLYFHIFKAMYYGAYRDSRNLTWYVGSVIYLVLCIESFMGYVLPWGQMSYWAAVVITNFIEAVPLVGKHLKLIFIGDYVIGDKLLRRFFVFHCVLPFILIILILYHVYIIHTTGQKGTRLMQSSMFFSYNKFWPKILNYELFAFTAYTFSLWVIILIFPNLFNSIENLSPASVHKTPDNIKPEWYFLPFYSILKGFESKTFGIISVVLIIVLFVLNPILNPSYNKFDKLLCFILFLSLILLAYAGQFSNKLCIIIIRFCFSYTMFYFLFPLFRIFGITFVKCVINKHL